MRHEINLSSEIEQALEKRASETGDAVACLIEAAVAAFVCNGHPPSSDRKPDPPLEPVEVVAPCDLPRRNWQLIAVKKGFRRLPDSIATPT